MFTRITQCAQCKTYDIVFKEMYYDKQDNPIGEWPLYYFGAKPSEPDKATHYFCGPACANDYHIANRSSTK